jgi:hypothetical protein
MVGWKFFFIDDPSWPTPPTGNPPAIGTLAYMGAGRTVLWMLGSKFLIEAIWKLIG